MNIYSKIPLSYIEESMIPVFIFAPSFLIHLEYPGTLSTLGLHTFCSANLVSVLWTKKL